MTVRFYLKRMYIFSVLFFLPAIFITAVNSYGQNAAKPSSSVLPESATFYDYLKYAESNNPELKAAYKNLTAAEEKVIPAGTLPDPRINYEIDDMGSGISAFQHKIELSQMFPWFGKRTLMREQAQIGVDISRQAYTRTKLKIRNDIVKAYSEYYYLSKSISITEDNMKLLSYLEGVIRAKYTVGEENQASIVKAQVELGMLEEQLLFLNDMTETSKANMNAVLNLPSDYSLPFPENIPDAGVTLSLDSLTEKLYKNNTDLKTIELNSKIENKDIELARKQFYPDFMLGVGTERLMNKSMEGNRNSFMGMFSMTIPVWRNSYSHNVKAAQARAGSTEKELENMRNNSASELKTAFYMYRDSERKINLYRNSLIPKTNELLAVSQRAYEAGKTDFLDIIDSQRTLIELELNYERAVSDRFKALAMIETLINENLIPNDDK